MAKSSDSLQESLTGMREAKAFTAENRQRVAYEGTLWRQLKARLQQSLWGASSGGVADIAATAGTVLVLWVGGRAVIAGTMPPGVLIAFVTYLGQLFGPTAWFVNLNITMQSALAGADRVFKVLDCSPTVRDAADALVLDRAPGEVQFQHVSFAYDDEDVLHDVSFTVHPGEICAIVGPSGAGKTTLINLVPRFADPRDGRITLGEYDLRQITQKSLRSHIGQVFQDPFLFSGSIADNILLGRSAASQAEIEAAARAANAHDFIQELPDGYATLVGERGVRLSGGQRQRIAIARAILRSPRILLLDEATSALDSTAEAAVQEALGHLMEGRTSFVIAHRLSTVLHADRILVLDAGRLVAMGTHTELLAASPLYRELHARQFREPAGQSVVGPVEND